MTSYQIVNLTIEALHFNESVSFIEGEENSLSVYEIIDP